MSTEQSKVSETPTQQATTLTPTTTPKREKNPKRVAAGKAVAERTRLAREQQKKAVAEAAVIIAKNKAKGSNSVAAATVSEPTLPTEDETPNSKKVDNSSLSTTQWIGIGGIVVSLIGIYYKREELKAAFSKKNTPEPSNTAAHINTVDDLQPVRTTLYRGQPRGIKHLD